MKKLRGLPGVEISSTIWKTLYGWPGMCTLFMTRVVVHGE